MKKSRCVLWAGKYGIYNYNTQILLKHYYNSMDDITEWHVSNTSSTVSLRYSPRINVLHDTPGMN